MGWLVSELIMDLVTVFRRTGTALFKYVQNTPIVNCCYLVILRQILTSDILLKSCTSCREVGGELQSTSLRLPSTPTERHKCWWKIGGSM